MNTGTRVALIYGVAVAGSALVAYLRGREMADVIIDSLIHGAVVGTGLNVVVWLSKEESAEAMNYVPPERQIPVMSYGNPGLLDAFLSNPQAMGALGREALALLEKVNPDVLKPIERDGVRVGPAPDDPHIINPPQD